MLLARVAGKPCGTGVLLGLEQHGNAANLQIAIARPHSKRQCVAGCRVREQTGIFLILRERRRDTRLVFDDLLQRVDRRLQILCRGVGLGHCQTALHRVGILTEHSREGLHRLVGRAVADIQAAEREIELGIGGDSGPGGRNFEIRDRLLDVGCCLRTVPFTACVSGSGVQQAEHAVGFDVLVVDRKRRFRRLLSVGAFVPAKMQRGNLGTDLGRLGIGSSGTVERRTRAFDVALGFEPSSQQEFVISICWRLSQRRQRCPDKKGGGHHRQGRAARKQHHAMILAQDAIFPSRS